jgi:hypothetical protein
MDEHYGPREWSALLEQTRQALSMLRAEDLEVLAARAETMFAAHPALDSPRPRDLEPSPSDRTKLTRERRLLRDLILATDQNRKILRRLHRTAPGRMKAEEGDQRWVR